MDSVDVYCLLSAIGAIIGAFIAVLMIIGSIKDSDEPDIIFTITFEPKDQDEDSTETK